MADPITTDAGALLSDVKAHPLKYALMLLFLLLAAVFASQWLKAREANMQAAAQSKVDAAIAKANDAKVSTLQQQVVSRDAVQVAVDQKAQADQNAVTSVSAANQVLSQQLAELASKVKGQPVQPQPVVTVEAGSATPVDLPNAPAGTKLTLLTPDQDEALAKAAIACKAQASGLDTCAKDKADLTAQVVAEKQTSAAWKSSSDTWEAAAKGGTKTTRFLRVLKFVACGAAGAAAGAQLEKAHPAKGSAIGSAAFTAGCSFVGK